MKNYLLGLVLLSLFGSCNKSPRPLDYGADGCHFCSMTIVDKQHAAQLMTHKGKTYSFDAAECMLHYLQEIDTTKVKLFLVNDYYAPGQFVDATQATYLISENIPSPMGEYLTAFADKAAAQRTWEEHQGTLYTWQALQERFAAKKKPSY